ncbi:MAG: lytic transglycosylase domain-containing protein [Bacteroidota bacterium]
MKLKISKLILIICLVTSSSMIASAPDLGGYKYDGKWSSKTDEFIKLALEDTAIPFRAEYSPLVKKWIKRHTIRGKKTFEKMLGKSAYYFPIFEHYLDTYELPKELKFLAMVESGLFPKIESSAGAVGLWQFMPGTADFYKLTINEWVDERKSPYRSSEAAAKMLSDLYNQFGDWKLVLAAYNCGPGRVSRAIRKSGSNDYEAIKRRLPKQTQEYVIKYIATAFVGTHFEAFGMQPVKQMIEVEKRQ